MASHQWVKETVFFLLIHFFFFPIQFLQFDYATKNKKTMRKKINTKNILIISHLLDDILFKYLSRAPCAPSTFANVSSMFSSILQSHYWFKDISGQFSNCIKKNSNFGI